MRQAAFYGGPPPLLEAGRGCRLLKQPDMPITGSLAAFASG